MPRRSPHEVLEYDLDDYEDLIPDWELSCRAVGKGDGTMKAYRQGTDSYLAYARSVGDTSLTKLGVQAWMTHLLQVENKSKNTVCNRLVGLRSFSAWLAEEGETPADILYDVKQPKLDKKLVGDVHDDDLKKIIAACKGTKFVDFRDEALVRLMVETGLRSSEVLGIQVHQFERERGLIRIERGKGGKGRIVPIGTDTTECLARYLRKRRRHRLAETNTSLFLGDPNTGPGTFGYSAMWKQLGKRATSAGVDGFHPHKLRHTFGVRWKRAGGSDSGLMNIAGWASPSMIEIYTGHAAQELSIAEARNLDLGKI